MGVTGAFHLVFCTAVLGRVAVVVAGEGDAIAGSDNKTDATAKGKPNGKESEGTGHS